MFDIKGFVSFPEKLLKLRKIKKDKKRGQASFVKNGDRPVSFRKCIEGEKLSWQGGNALLVGTSSLSPSCSSLQFKLLVALL